MGIRLSVSAVEAGRKVAIGSRREGGLYWFIDA
jgi:hypothetical protein